MTNQEAIEFLSQIKDFLLANNSWLPSTDNPIKESFGMAINALTTQEKERTEMHACDCVSRKDAIDAMANTLWHYPNECYRNLNEYEFAKGLAELGLKSVPSVQPEPCGDVVSRQAAIDAMCELMHHWFVGDPKDEIREIKQVLENLPSAQPKITLESAIDYLHKIGWMQEHDRILTESAQPEPSTEIQEILEYLDTTLHPIVSPDNWNVYAELHDTVSKLPSAQPKRDIPLDYIIDEDGNAICPKCGANAEWHKYCEECGQALKWEDENER